MLRNRVLSFAGLAVLICAFASSSLSQAPNTAAMVINIVDQNGAVVPGASITVTDTTTGAERELTSNGDGTVTDNRTGLIWQQAETAAMTWEAALQYAKQLPLGGLNDWRLPNIKELESLNNERLVNPSIPKAVFPGAQEDVYWASTTLLNHPTRAWTVDFTFGIASYEEKTEKLLVRAVRGKP